LFPQWEQLLIDECDQVVANAGSVMIKLAVCFGRGPFVPTVFPANDRSVILAVEFGTITALSFEVV